MKLFALSLLGILVLSNALLTLAADTSNPSEGKAKSKTEILAQEHAKESAAEHQVLAEMVRAAASTTATLPY
jgi:hypothetical protein